MPGDADRHVDVEDPVPRQIGDDEPADRRPEDRPDGRRNHQPGHRVDQLGLRHRAQHHQPPDRRHHRPAHALQHARRHQERECRRLRAADRAQGEQRDRGPEHRA